MISFSKRRIVFLIIVLALCWMMFNVGFCSINDSGAKVKVDYTSNGLEVKTTVSSINVSEADVKNVSVKIDGKTKTLSPGDSYSVKTQNKVFITIPKYLNDLKIESVSGSISAYELSAKDICLNTVSGSINGSDISNPDNVMVNSVSGSINYTSSTDNDFTAESVSGSVNVKSNAKDINLKSVSGSISLDSEDNNHSFDFTTVSGTWNYNGSSGSGKINFNSDSDNSIKAETVSGSITVF